MSRFYVNLMTLDKYICIFKVDVYVLLKKNMKNIFKANAYVLKHTIQYTRHPFKPMKQ